MTYPPILYVEVLLEDLALGRPGNFLECPIARALKRMGYRFFSVTEKWITFDEGPVIYQTPRAAAKFIEVYDAGYVPRMTRSFYFRRWAAPVKQEVLL